MDDNNPLRYKNDSATLTLSRQSNLDKGGGLPAHHPATASPDPTDIVNRNRLWWVAQSRPQYEQRLVEDIDRLARKKPQFFDCFAFSPREEIVRSRQDRDGHFHHERRSRFIFQSYVFYSGDRDVAFESPALLKVLKTTQADCRDIENLLTAYQAGPVRRSASECLGIKAGIRVKVVSGPFVGTEGRVERFGDTRIVMTVGMLGGAEISTDLRHIEPLWGD